MRSVFLCWDVSENFPSLSEARRRTINSIIGKYNIDLKESFAFGSTDLEMLRKAGNPVVVNSNSLLPEYAFETEFSLATYRS